MIEYLRGFVWSSKKCKHTDGHSFGIGIYDKLYCFGLPNEKCLRVLSFYKL